MNRTLRSKSKRARLWYAADGMCLRCGGELGDDWEADHVIPWSVTKRTVEDEMQALCAVCNRAKGAVVFQHRAHQKEMDEICQQICAGRDITRIYVHTVTGGGKSLLAPIMANRFIPGIVDSICWVVPRLTLQQQAEESFLKQDYRAFSGHTNEIRVSTNGVNPCGDKQGWVTTYQALLFDQSSEGAGITLREFKRKRIWLILDEFHHMHEGSALERAMAPIVAAAAGVTFMTGTMQTNDNKKISYAHYIHDDVQRKSYLSTPDKSDVALNYAFIRYSRQDALADKAIKPLVFFPMDAAGAWTDRKNVRREVLSFTDAGDQTRSMIWTVLHTQYADHLLTKTVDHWRGHQAGNPGSKLLVVAPKIALAKTYLKRLKTLGVRADIATSEDTPAAKATIDAFKVSNTAPGALEALVSVQMAYEGMDVPEITHVACLTHIRSIPWLEQMLGRASRIVYPDQGRPDPLPIEQQRGYIFGPDDKYLLAVMEDILADQAPFVRDPTEGPPPPGSEYEPLIPHVSTLTRERMMDLVTGEVVSYEESARTNAAIRAVGAEGMIDPLLFRRAMMIYDSTQVTEPLAVILPMQTASQREMALRINIQNHAQEVEGRRGLRFGTINGRCLAKFKKGRNEMTETELEEAWLWINKTYPLENLV